MGQCSLLRQGVVWLIIFAFDFRYLIFDLEIADVKITLNPH